MKKIFTLVLLLSTVLAVAQSNVKLKKVKVGDGIATMMLPQTFVGMTQDEMDDEFASNRPPIGAYRDAKYPCALGISQNSTAWNSTDLEMFKAFHKSTIMSIHSEVHIINEEVKQIGNTTFVIFEFTASVKPVRVSVVDKGDLKKYNYVQYTIQNGELLGFNFSCPFTYKRQWERTAKQMMDSVVIK